MLGGGRGHVFRFPLGLLVSSYGWVAWQGLLLLSGGEEWGCAFKAAAIAKRALLPVGRRHPSEGCSVSR